MRWAWVYVREAQWCRHFEVALARSIGGLLRGGCGGGMNPMMGMMGMNPMMA